MTDDELQAITFDHERRVDDFIKARIALEESARLIVAASALNQFPEARWVEFQESDQGDGLWLECAFDENGDDLYDNAGHGLDQGDWASAAATDIHTRDGLVVLGDGWYALEVQPPVDAWTGA